MWFYCKEKNKPVTRKKRNVTLERATIKCADDSAVKLADTGCAQTHTGAHKHTFITYICSISPVGSRFDMKALKRSLVH